jgi:hypothetical protein
MDLMVVSLIRFDCSAIDEGFVDIVGYGFVGDMRLLICCRNRYSNERGMECMEVSCSTERDDVPSVCRVFVMFEGWFVRSWYRSSDGLYVIRVG